MSRNSYEGVPFGAPFVFAQRENAVGGTGNYEQNTSELRAIYERITNKLRANLLYIENMREYD